MCCFAVTVANHSEKFVYLVNHGVPQEKMDGIIGWVRTGTILYPSSF